MMTHYPISDQAVAATFAAFAPPQRQTLLSLRDIILDTAATNPMIGPLDESLKWGEPAYRPARNRVGTTVRLGDQAVTLGRSQESTIVLDDDYVSSRHARFFPQDGYWLVEDLGSTNGTYLDRTKVTTATVVKVGQPVRIGKTVVELRK